MLKVHKSRLLGTIPRMETCSHPKPSLSLRRHLCSLLSSCGVHPTSGLCNALGMPPFLQGTGHLPSF